MNTTSEKVTKARSQLVVQHPFFASIAMSRPIIESANIPTAAADEAGNIYINPEWIADLTIEQLQFALAHEALHVMLHHAGRRDSRDPAQWNSAADAVINETLVSSKVGRFVDGGVRMAGAEQMSAEQVYRDMHGSHTRASQPPGGIGEDLIPGDASASRGDSNSSRQLTAAERADIETQLDIELSQVATAAKAQGKLPAHMDRLVKEVIDPPTPWYDILARFMQDNAASDYSWLRPNRRFASGGTYLPSLDSHDIMGAVVVAVDTSSSVSDREMAHFIGHLNSIIETAQPLSLYILWCTSEVEAVDTYTPDDYPLSEDAIKPVGMGGTRFAPVFKYIDDENVHPDCLIYLTDGYGDQATLDEPDYPVLWLTTDYTKGFAFGEVIEYKI